MVRVGTGQPSGHAVEASWIGLLSEARRALAWKSPRR